MTDILIVSSSLAHIPAILPFTTPAFYSMRINAHFSLYIFLFSFSFYLRSFIFARLLQYSLFLTKQNAHCDGSASATFRIVHDAAHIIRLLNTELCSWLQHPLIFFYSLEVCAEKWKDKKPRKTAMLSNDNRKNENKQQSGEGMTGSYGFWWSIERINVSTNRSATHSLTPLASAAENSHENALKFSFDFVATGTSTLSEMKAQTEKTFLSPSHKAE